MLHFIDVIIIAVYLIGTIVIGIACRGRQQSANDYFTAGGRMRSTFQSLLVGLSIAATLFSGISFLAYPSIVYSYGAAVLLALVCFPLSWLLLKFWFLPHFFSTGVKYPYDIIENKLGPHIRTLAAAMYMLLRIGWMAALIYAPTIAILAAANLDDSWLWPIILVIGLSSTLYTTLGGIRGVIVTDAIQFVVIALGIVITVGFIVFRLPVPPAEMFQYLQSRGSLKMFDYSLDPTKMFTVWSIIIGYSTVTISMYIADQMSLQRYLAAGDMKSASRSFTSNIIGVIPVICLLAAVGLSLATWYHYMPDPNLPKAADKIFPYFIATQLPVGIAGLLLAAILAATVSSMTSGVNTLAATVTIDFRVRFGTELTPRQQLRFGKIASLIIGLFATLVAGVVKYLGTIFDITQILSGLFLGPLLVCVIFSVTTIPVNRKMLALGMIAGVFAAGIVAWSPWASLWVSPIGSATSFICALLGTWILGADRPKENTREEMTTGVRMGDGS